jgi:L-ascorbate metabolism protein UlaG (beta-lactamase superfamily)
MKIQFLRHATFVLFVQNKKILVDPMFSDAGTLSPVPLTANSIRNPRISLPVAKEHLIVDIDAVLLTHYHFDHFDREASKLIPKNMLIFCQPGDDKKLKRDGFQNVLVIGESIEWESLSIQRFPGNHAQENIFKMLLGKSSSYFIKSQKESLFITGDALFDKFLVNSLEKIQPNLIVANTGAAEFFFGKSITLNFESLKQIGNKLPESKIIAVHMDAINHCRLTKVELKRLLVENSIMSVIVPDEGNVLTF